MALPLHQTASESLWRKQVTAKIAGLVTGVSSVFGRTGAVVATAGDYTATQITNTPAGGIAAVTVQAALNELDTEKANSADLGTAAAEDIGTSGGTVPLLNGTNTWSAAQSFGDVNFDTFSATGVTNGKTTVTNSIMDSSRDNTAAREHHRFYNPNGQVGSISTSGTNTAFNTTCDGRLKEDLRDFDALAILSQMQFYDFRWIGTGERDYGPIAQQLLESFPRAVHVPEDDGPLQYNPGSLVPVLAKAILQMRVVNAVQTQRILDLESRVTALEGTRARA